MLVGEIRDRVIEEQDQLRVKINKLGQFIYSDAIKGLDYDEVMLLKKQLEAMEHYNSILTDRLNYESTKRLLG